MVLTQRAEPMDNKQQLHELTVIHTEYHHYFDRSRIVLCDSNAVNNAIQQFLKSKPQVNHLLLSADGNQWKVTVDIAGWHQVDHTDYFPTFESLMLTIYPQFNKKFNNELFDKLSNLQTDTS